MIRRFNRFSNAHPLLSIFLGFAVVFALVMLIVPQDPPSVDAARDALTHVSKGAKNV